jgi:solute carrier family 45 protein 1/2/4
VWRRSGAKPAAVDADDISDNEKAGINSHDRSLAHTRNILIRQVWKPSLAALAVSLVATCLLVLSTTPAAAAATTMISLLLGANGMLFALANWVPYALIADEASALARAKAMTAAEGEGGCEEEEGDDTPKLLAVHNMSITAPQIVASAASWLLMQGLAVMGLEQRAVWLFVMCIPAAIWAACL